MLLGMAPLAALPAAELRDQVLTLCADGTPQALAQRAAIVSRAESFGPSGFPVPIDPPKLARWPGHGHAPAAAGATAATAAIAAITVLAIGASHHGRQPSVGSWQASRRPAPLPSPSAPGRSHPAAPPAAAHPPVANGPSTGLVAAPGVPTAARYTPITGPGSGHGSGPGSGPEPPGSTLGLSTAPTTPAPPRSPSAAPSPPPPR
jgi:hypothetical protein